MKLKPVQELDNKSLIHLYTGLLLWLEHQREDRRYFGEPRNPIDAGAINYYINLYKRGVDIYEEEIIRRGILQTAIPDDIPPIAMDKLRNSPYILLREYEQLCYKRISEK